MAENVWVLNTGVGIPTDFSLTPSGSFNVSTSTNPRVVTEDSANPQSLGLHCYEIHSDDAASGAGFAMGSGTVSQSKLNRLFPVSTTVADYATNLFENPGYRITLDTGSGVTLAADRDYFVIIYADNMYKHHMAKITEKQEYEGSIFNFDFEPALKENIPSGTKVAIYQGPYNLNKSGLGADNVVAVGYGLLNDPDPISGTNTTDERHDKYVEVSRPTFYFYDGKTALDHDRKYTVTKISTNSTTMLKSVFVTDSPTSGYILDKSFFTQNATLVDNNKLNDRLLNGANAAPRGINTHNAQGGTYSFDHTTWAGSSKNYDDSDGGLKTYISYIDSPTRCQSLGMPYLLNTKKTVTNKGNMFEAKFYDTERMLDRKINENERVIIKEMLGSKEVNDENNAQLPGKYNKLNSNTIVVSGLDSGQDLKRLLGSSAPYEPILIEGVYYIISSIGNPLDGSQNLNISHRRGLSEVAYSALSVSAIIDPIGDAKAYRKVWSSIVGNFLLGHDIDTHIATDGSGTIKRNGKNLTVSGGTVYQNSIYSEESDVFGLEYVFDGKYYGHTMKVLRGEIIEGYTALDFEPESSYYSGKDILNSLTGSLKIYRTIFEGKIESKEVEIEHGQFKFNITGRDIIADLLNTTINTNYTYSEEYVYSTFSPYNNNYIDIGVNVSSISGAVVAASASANVEFGDVLYLKGTKSSVDSYYLLGVVKSVSGSNITLVKDCYISKHTTFIGGTILATDIYKARRTVLAGKTLETSLRNSDRATTLIGSADKGAIFTSGNYFDYGTVYTDTGKLSTITSRTVENCSYSNGTTITTPSNGTVNLISGMLVRGTGIPTNATIVSITNSTSFLLSATTTGGSLTGQSLIFGDTNGFAINNLVDTIGDETGYTDSPIGFDFNHNTISSMVDFPIIDTTSGGGYSIHTVGYVSPIVVGRIETDNLLDTFIESASTAQASRKNNNIYLINGQGMPLGGFLHLLDGMVNADKSPKTFNNVFEEDPTLNATVNSQYALRFNTPIWRYVNKCIGRLGRRLDTKITGSVNSGFGFHYNDYYEKDSNYNFYASGYKANIGRVPTADEHKDDTLSYRLDLPTERTGLQPAVGSRAYDITRYPNNFDTSLYNFGRRLEMDDAGINMNERYKAMYELYDNYSGPLHIFSVGDVYPESKKNPNNIGFTDGDYSRNISDYGVVFKGEPKGNETSFSHTNWTGKSVIKNRIDSDYFYQPVQDSKGDLRRMNLVRLTDVTYDMMMNEVDYEHYKHDNTGGNKTQEIISEQLVKNSHIVKSFPESGFSPYDIKIHTQIAAGTSVTLNSSTWWNGTFIFTLYTDPYNSFSTTHAQNTAGFGVPILIGQVSANPSSGVLTVPAMGPLHPAVGYPANASVYVTVKLAAETDSVMSVNILGNNTSQFPIIIVTDVDNGDGEMNHNYNKTMALVNVGDGVDDSVNNFVDGSGNDIVDAYGWPLTYNSNLQALAFHDHNAIVKVPYIPGSTTQGKHFHANAPHDLTRFFRWNFNANFNDAEMTIMQTDPLALKFFNSDGSPILRYNNMTYALTVGSDSNYSRAYLKLTGVTNSVLTFSTSLSSTVSPNWTDSDETNCTLTYYGTTVTTHTPQRIFPIRLIQDAKNGTSFDFKNMHPVVMDIPSYGGNTGSEKLGSGTECEVIGAVYVAEPYANEFKSIIVRGTKHDETDYSADGLDMIIYDNSSVSGQQLGLFENNGGATIGADFSGVRPLETLFKPFIDVDDGFTIINHSSDAGLKTSEKILTTTMTVDNVNPNISSGINSWICYSNNLTGYYLYGNSKIYKIISHTVAKNATTFKHYLKIDNATSNPTGNLTLMKINQICTYDYSPKEIKLNKPSYSYTKKPGSAEMMSDVAYSLGLTHGKARSGGTYSAGVKTGGVMSLYTIIEPDGVGGNYLIPRTASEISLTNSFPANEDYKVYITDGKNSHVTSMHVSSNKILTFSDMKEMKGTPSIGSLFDITVTQSPDFRPKSISICAPLKIVREAEEIADDILSNINLPYNKSNSEDKYFLGANFTGENAYTAVNSALSYKDLKLRVSGESIQIVSDEDEKDYRDIVFSEDDEKYKIISIKRDVSLYDKYNSVIVYGDGVKGIAINYKDVKKRGKQYTKEVYDFSIVDSKQVDEKAIKLLQLYTSLQSGIIIEVGNRIPFLEAGHIVTLSYRSENIPTDEYIVIEINKEMGYPIKILLGQYSRDLANTFSMLLSETRNLQGRSKQKVYTSVTSPNVVIQTVRVKLVKTTITKSTSTGSGSSAVLGFTKTLGLDSGLEI